MRFVGYRHCDGHGRFAEDGDNRHIAFGYKGVLCRRRQTVSRRVFPAHKRVPAVRRCRQGNRIAALHRRSAADRSVRRIVRRRRNDIRISRKFCRQRSIPRHAECVFGTFGYRRAFRILPRNKAVVFVRRCAHRHFRTEYDRRRTRNRAHRIIVCRNGHVIRNCLKHRFERHFTAEYRKRVRRFFGNRGTARILPFNKCIMRLRRRSYRYGVAQCAGSAARHRAVCFVCGYCRYIGRAVIVRDRCEIDIPVHTFIDVRNADVVQFEIPAFRRAERNVSRLVLAGELPDLHVILGSVIFFAFRQLTDIHGHRVVLRHDLESVPFSRRRKRRRPRRYGTVVQCLETKRFRIEHENFCGCPVGIVRRFPERYAQRAVPVRPFIRFLRRLVCRRKVIEIKFKDKVPVLPFGSKHGTVRRPLKEQSTVFRNVQALRLFFVYKERCRRRIHVPIGFVNICGFFASLQSIEVDRLVRSFINDVRIARHLKFRTESETGLSLPFGYDRHLAVHISGTVTAANNTVDINLQLTVRITDDPQCVVVAQKIIQRYGICIDGHAAAQDVHIARKVRISPEFHIHDAFRIPRIIRILHSQQEPERLIRYRHVDHTDRGVNLKYRFLRRSPGFRFHNLFFQNQALARIHPVKDRADYLPGGSVNVDHVISVRKISPIQAQIRVEVYVVNDLAVPVTENKIADHDLTICIPCKITRSRFGNLMIGRPLHKAYDTHIIRKFFLTPDRILRNVRISRFHLKRHADAVSGNKAVIESRRVLNRRIISFSKILYFHDVCAAADRRVNHLLTEIIEHRPCSFRHIRGVAPRKRPELHIPHVTVCVALRHVIKFQHHVLMLRDRRGKLHLHGFARQIQVILAHAVRIFDLRVAESGRIPGGIDRLFPFFRHRRQRRGQYIRFLVRLYANILRKNAR